MYLHEKTTIRFNKGDKKKRKAFMKEYKGIYDNDSHLIRCAVNYFIRNYNSNKNIKKVK